MIRNAQIEDSWAIAEAHVASWKHTYIGQVPDEYLAGLSVPAREAAWRESFAKEEHRILLAEDGDLAAGFVSLGPSRDEDADPKTTGEVYAIYLRPEYQGRGLGTELWRRAVDSLRASGCAELTVWVLDTNSSARRFYEGRACFLDGESKEVSIGGKDVVELRYRYKLK